MLKLELDWYKRAASADADDLLGLAETLAPLIVAARAWRETPTAETARALEAAIDAYTAADD